jgi:hypothetical protein
MLKKTLLQCPQHPVSMYIFNSFYPASTNLACWNKASAALFTVYQNGACAAIPGITTDFGARQL